MAIKQFFLKRLSNTMEHGVFGVLLDGDIPFAVTLELPWKDNKEKESCIPIGTYLCERVLSPNFGNTFEVTGVDNRTHILFHKGNLDDDTLGCILVGEMFGSLCDESGILKSGQGFGEFLQRLECQKKFSLHIMWA